MILEYLFWIIVCIGIIIIAYLVLDRVLNEAFGQEAPAPITPTPVPTPTPTSPNPNLQYLPQKAYVQAYAPENGIPSTSGALQVVPQVVPVPQQSQGIAGFDMNTVLSVLSMIVSGGSGFLAKVGLDKSKKNQETVQEVAQTQVKQIEVEEEHLGLTFDQMPQKGNEITNKPIIKQDNIKDIKDKAIETASKA